jgi:hypothetical protein
MNKKYVNNWPASQLFVAILTTPLTFGDLRHTLLSNLARQSELRSPVNEQILQEQLAQRLTLLESSSNAEHLVEDLPARDIAVSVLVLALVAVALLWWAY